jgi:hypothetical protein
MSQKIVVYAAETYVSVEVTHGASRTTTGATFPAVVAALHPDDLARLEAFARGMLQTILASRQIAGAAA